MFCLNLSSSHQISRIA